MPEQVNLNEIYRAIGTLEGKIDNFITAVNKQEDRINGLEKITDQYLGKTSIIGSIVGFIGGIIASLIIWATTNK